MTDLRERIAKLEALEAARPSKKRMVIDLGRRFVDIDAEYYNQALEMMDIIREQQAYIARVNLQIAEIEAFELPVEDITGLIGRAYTMMNIIKELRAEIVRLKMDLSYIKENYPSVIMKWPKELL